MMIKMMRNALLVNTPLRLPRACLGNAYRFYPETRKENADSRT